MNGRNVIAAAFRQALPDLPDLADIRLANAIVESVDVLVFDALRQALSLVPLEQRVDAAEALADRLTTVLEAAGEPGERYRRKGSLVYLLEPSRDPRGRGGMRNRITARVEAADSGEAEVAAARFRRSAEVEDAARALIQVMHKRGIHLPETAALLAALSHDPSE